MRLSILIPTHNRPELFERCLASALLNKPDDVEIIVNNDSDDIITKRAPQTHFWYNRYPHLSQVYQHLLFQTSSDYVYFLEDDDYLKEDFYETVLPLLGKYDIICGNYYPTYNATILRSHLNGRYFGDDIVDSVNTEHLQLSKFIFKRDLIDDYPFKADSDIRNDEYMFKHAAAKASNSINIPNVLYYQTVDGGDNISFEEFNK